MGCGTCGVSVKNGGGSAAAGCKSKGNCSTGGCNRLNSYNWLADLPASAERDSFNVIEVSFKNGSTKDFYRNNLNTIIVTGDHVVVETSYGFQVGRVSMSGELVRLQMRKKRVKEDADSINRVLRKATETDVERAREFAAMEPTVLTHARVIARDLNMNMKIGDVEYQADGRKIIFYYTAETRVDFRELIRHYAREFRVRVEMCQIGPRQEAGKIGGIGSCGRELCCSTWLTDFKTVTTGAARYQNLSVNQAKLSGQCGRLKCCLNFELDTYLDALKVFPKKAHYLKLSETLEAKLIKTNIFKKRMWYIIPGKPIVELSIDRVKEIQELNAKGEYPEELVSEFQEEKKPLLEDLSDYSNTVEQIDLPELAKRKRSRNKNRNSRDRDRSKSRTQAKSQDRNQGGAKKQESGKNSPNKDSRSKNQSRSSKYKNKSKNTSPKNTKTDTNASGESNNASAKGNNRNRNQSKNRSNKPKDSRNQPKNDSKNSGNKGGQKPPQSKGPKNDKPTDSKKD